MTYRQWSIIRSQCISRGAFRHTVGEKAFYPVTEQLCESVLCLPIRPYFEESEVEMVCERDRSRCFNFLHHVSCKKTSRKVIMQFNSYIFILAFMPAMLFIYFLCSKINILIGKIAIIAGSIIFYAYLDIAVFKVFGG